MATDLTPLPLSPASAPDQSPDDKANEQGNLLPSCDADQHPQSRKTENQVEPFMAKESHDDSINTSGLIIRSPDAQLLQLKEAESLCSSNQTSEHSTVKNETKEADPTEFKEDATEPPLPAQLPDQEYKTPSAADHLTIEAESSSKEVAGKTDKPAFLETNQQPTTATLPVQPITEFPDSELEVKEKQNSEACANELATQKIIEGDETSVGEDKKEAEGEKEVTEKQISEACADELATKKIIEGDESSVVEDTKEVENEKDVKEKQNSEGCADVLATGKIIEGDESSVVEDTKEVENEKDVKEKQNSEACADVMVTQKIIEGNESSVVEDTKEVENEKDVKEKQNSEACADVLATQKIIEGDETSVVEDSKDAENKNDDKPVALSKDKDEEKSLDQVVPEIVTEPIKKSEKEHESAVKEKEIVVVSIREPATQVTDKKTELTSEDKEEGNDMKGDKPTLSETSIDPTVTERPKESEKEPELNVHVSAGEVSDKRIEGGSSMEDFAQDKEETEDEKLNLSETNRDATVIEPTKESKKEGELEVKEKENVEASVGEESGVKEVAEGKEAKNIKDDDKPGFGEQEEGLTATPTELIKESQKEAEGLEVKEKEKVVGSMDDSVQEKEAKIEEGEVQKLEMTSGEGKEQAKNMAKEGAGKPSPKQSNNIISKVKQSLVKAKKAIIGKSSTPKAVSTETKGEIKVT